MASNTTFSSAIMNATLSETLSTRTGLDGLTGGPSQVKMLLASFIASTSQLCRPFANFALMLQDLPQWLSSQRKDTMSHLHFVLQQTHPSRRPDFAKYPTLLSKAVFICDPYIWPSLASKTIRTILSPAEIWRFMGWGPLVAPIPYFLFLCSLFGILNDPKVKSVKRSTWIMAACVWISSMALLALAENTKGGKHATEALLAIMASSMDYLPSLQPLDELVERTSQAVGLPFRFLPSWLFLAKLGYHIFLICRDVYHGWRVPQPQVANNEQRRSIQRPTRETAYRAEGLPQDENQERQAYVAAMRRHFAVIEEQLAIKAMHEANMQRILDEWREAEGQEQIAAADTQSELTSLASGLEGMEEDENNIDAEGDGEMDEDSLENQQPSAGDSQSPTGSVEPRDSADQLHQEPGNAPEMEEEIFELEYNSPEHQQPSVDQIQSPTSPARDQDRLIADQPPKESVSGSPIEAEDGGRAYSSLEHQRASVDFSISPTSPVGGPNLADELDGEYHDGSDYEEDVEEDANHSQGGEVDDQGSPQITYQTGAPSHGGDGFEMEEEQNSQHSTQSYKSSRSADRPENEAEQSSPPLIDQTADYSHSEYSNEGDEQSSPQTSDAAEPSHGRDDHGDEEQSSSPSAPSFHRTESQLEDFRPQSSQSIDLADLEDSQYFIDGSDYRAVADEMPGFLEPEFWKPERQQKGKERARTDPFSPQASPASPLSPTQTVRPGIMPLKSSPGRSPTATVRPGRATELTRMAGEQFGDEHVTVAEVEAFRQEGQREKGENKVPSDHLKKFAEAQSFTSKADEKHDIRRLEIFMEEGEASEQARQQARPDGNQELKNFQQGQAFVDEEDEQHNARSLERFVEDHEAELQQGASQLDLKALSNAQSFVEEAEVDQTVREVDNFIEECKAEEQAQQASQPDLKALSNLQSFVEEDEVNHSAREVDNFIEEGEAEEQAQQAQQASQPDLKSLSNAQSFVNRAQIAQTTQEVNDFIEQGKAEEQQNEKKQADRKEELKNFQRDQAFITKKDEQHNQRSLNSFIQEGEAEKQVQQVSQPDLKALSNAQAFVDDGDEQHNARSFEVFIEEGKAEEQQQQEAQEEKQGQKRQQPDLRTLKEAQFFGDEHESGDESEEHDKAVKDSSDASSTHGDDDDGRQPIHQEHEGDDNDAVAAAENSDTEPDYTLSNTRDYYDGRLDKGKAAQRGE